MSVASIDGATVAARPPSSRLLQCIKLIDKELISIGGGILDSIFFVAHIIYVIRKA